MISLFKSGEYTLLETKADTKVLHLNGLTYAWVNAKGIGEILVTTHRQHQTDAVLSIGEFKMYEVHDEPGVTDLIHLELNVGNGVWQSYLLLTGLPNDSKKRARIIPTRNYITGKRTYIENQPDGPINPIRLRAAKKEQRKEVLHS